MVIFIMVFASVWVYIKGGNLTDLDTDSQLLTLVATNLAFTQKPSTLQLYN